MSLWQVHAMADGFRKAHQSEEEARAELSDDEIDGLSDFIDQ